MISQQLKDIASDLRKVASVAANVTPEKPSAKLNKEAQAPAELLDSKKVMSFLKFYAA